MPPLRKATGLSLKCKYIAHLYYYFYNTDLFVYFFRIQHCIKYLSSYCIILLVSNNLYCTNSSTVI